MTWNLKKDIFANMAGHGISLDGTFDVGCVYSAYTEAGLMLKITQYENKYLRACGIRVISDANKENNRNMISSVSWANKKSARFINQTTAIIILLLPVFFHFIFPRLERRWEKL